MTNNYSFVRLTDIPAASIREHMSDPRVAKHLPLMTKTEWQDSDVDSLVKVKEACWTKDGLGHWAILSGETYIGWGGFQKEAKEWDFGLVLHPDHFGHGLRITHQALRYAADHPDIFEVTFLLAPSRKNLGALKRFGAEFVGEVNYADQAFLKYRLALPKAQGSS